MDVLNVPAWVILNKVSMYLVNLRCQLTPAFNDVRSLTIPPLAWHMVELG